MGSGAWTTQASKAYYNTRGIDVNSINVSTVNQFYTATKLDKNLSPLNTMRECRDSDEHPNTIPVILALDVTGSMGSAIAAVARQLNSIMTKALQEFDDIEFCVMGIGDLAYDRAPIQISQYESDIRILESLDKIYFERGGGGNRYESYSAAWYMGLYHTDLDCWKRNKKGIIITMGDESLNPYLPSSLWTVTGDNPNGHIIDTKELYQLASEKFDIYHIGITDDETCFRYYADEARNSFTQVMGQHYLESESDKLPEVITQILKDSTQNVSANAPVITFNNGEGISW